MHRWALTSILMSAISDIWHRHLLFRYRRQICRTEKRHSDIGSLPISTSALIPISDIEVKIFLPVDSNARPLGASAITLSYCAWLVWLDCRISDKTLFRYLILCQTPISQSDIGRSDIRLSPISLITDIGLSAHLCVYACIWPRPGPELEPEPKPEPYSDKRSEPKQSSNFPVPQPWLEPPGNEDSEYSLTFFRMSVDETAMHNVQQQYFPEPQEGGGGVACGSNRPKKVMEVATL